MAMVRLMLNTAMAMLLVFILKGCTVMLYSAYGRPLVMVYELAFSLFSLRVVVTGPTDCLLSGG